jgi:antitoxin HicB
MTADELLRKLRRHREVRIVPSRGKGGHVRVERGDRVTHVPTGSGELKTGLLHGILRQLGLTIGDLR